MIGSFAAIIGRDLRLAWRRPGEALTLLAFFLIVATLYPLATQPTPAVLRTAGPAIIWIAALLASALPLGTLFKADLEDGSLEQITFSSTPLAWLMFGRVMAHWLMTGLPLALLSPLLASAFALPADVTPTLFMSLLVATPILSLTGALGAALTAGTRQASTLVALLVLPLQMPALIFGARASYMAMDGLDAGGALLLLGSLLALSAALVPFAIAAAVRISVEQT